MIALTAMLQVRTTFLMSASGQSARTAVSSTAPAFTSCVITFTSCGFSIAERTPLSGPDGGAAAFFFLIAFFAGAFFAGLTFLMVATGAVLPPNVGRAAKPL